MASERILAVGKIEDGQVVILTKDVVIEQLLSTITDDDWAAYEAYLDAQDAAWFAAQGIDVEAELQELQDDVEDRNIWRSGQW